MSERLYPYIVFLPIERKQRVLQAIFGSLIPIDILKFSINQGISKKIYQKDLIKSLDYSNKTIIEYLKKLIDLGVLEEHMEKTESLGRTVWVKFYVLTDLGRWFALLLAKEEALSKVEKAEILISVFRSYAKWLKEFAEKLGVKKEDLQEIFTKEME
jgi:predicted ArsR family transcriptional regulator